MMHGGSQWILGNAHVAGATVAFYTEPNFHADKILDLVQKAGVISLTFLGDAMGRPVAEAILAEPDRWDLSSLAAVSNGAAPLSEGVRAEVRRALPGRYILDTYGSSESGAAASKIDDGTDGPAGRPNFSAGPDIEVFDENLKRCPSGSRDARTLRPHPLGYYKDPVKTAATFKQIDGVRWTITGDFARRERTAPSPSSAADRSVSTPAEKGAPRGGRSRAATPRRRLRRRGRRDPARAMGRAGHRTGSAP